MMDRYLLLCVTLIPIAVFANAEYDLPPAISYSDGVFLDWSPQLSHEKAVVCRGDYIPPTFYPRPQDELFLAADEVFLADVGTSTLTGNVILEENNRRVFSQKIYLDRSQEGEVTYIDSPGLTLVEQPGLRIMGDHAYIVPDGQSTLENVQYRYYPSFARGTAQSIEYITDEPTLLYHASYTTCSPESNAWEIEGSTVRLNQESGRGEAFNSFLKIHDVPVLYFPYINFPIDDRRKTGFLMPEFSWQTDSGFIFSTPYYFNLAPNYDATFYPIYYTERGLQYGSQVRYLDEYSETKLYGTYLPHDRGFASFQETQRTNPSYPDPMDPRLTGVTDVGTDRWNIALEHISVFDSHWDGSVIYNQVSDDNYFVDFATDIFNRDERNLLQRAQLNYADDIFAGAALVQNYQILQPFDNELYSYPYQILPHFELDVTPDQTYWGNATAMNAQYTYFNHNGDPFDEKPTIGSRAHLYPVVQRPYRKSYGYLLPAVEFRYTQYDLTLSEENAALESNDNISRALPTAYVDAGLVFDRNTTFLGNDYAQTLEPRLFYLYTPFVDQNDIPLFDTSLYDFNTDQLFRTNRFNGLDRIADANQLSAGITTRYYDQDTRFERLRATIGQILYFQDREVVLCNVELDPDCFEYENLGNDSTFSPFVGDMQYYMNDHWSTLGGIRLDPTPAKTDMYRLLFYYRSDDEKQLRFGVHYDESGNNIFGAEPGTSEAVLLQSDVGFSWQLNSNWAALGQWYYDLQNNFSMEVMGALQYESCCWAIRTGARRSLIGDNEIITEREFETQLFLQFIFKGLGGFGVGPAGLLVDGFPGYTEQLSGGNY